MLNEDRIGILASINNGTFNWYNDMEIEEAINLNKHLQYLYDIGMIGAEITSRMLLAGDGAFKFRVFENVRLTAQGEDYLSSLSA